MHFIFGEKENETYYTRCGAYIIPLRDDKVGVINASKGYFLIGGGKEDGETDEETILRECREETGFLAVISEKVCSGESFVLDPDFGYFHPVQSYYSGSLTEKLCEPSEETNHLEWIAFDEIEEKLYSPMQCRAVKEVIEKECQKMNITVREYTEKDLEAMIEIWNEVVEDGVAFPQEEYLDKTSGSEFFASQTLSAVACDENDNVLGLYILHPNNIGRCGHICNASYAVRRNMRGLHIGEKLVSDCLVQGRKHGFGVLQFNAVVRTNIHARHLYERLGFTQLGVIPKGFRMKDGHYEDICPYYHEL